jgi:hypothetical protein
MKKITAYISTIALILGIYTEGSSQTYGLQVLGGTQVYIESGTTVNVVNNLSTKVDGTGSTINNNGTWATAGDLLNQNNGYLVNGLYQVGGSLNNTSAFGLNTTFEFNGDVNPATINTTWGLNNVTINKGPTNPVVNLASSIDITGVLTFTSGYLQLNGFNAAIDPAGSITGFSPTSYVITNVPSGKLIQRVSFSPLTFPVGTGVGDYTPMTIKQSFITVPTLSVSVQNNVLTNGVSGSPLTQGVVNKSWVIGDVGTPLFKQLTLTPQWNGSNEASLDGTKCGLSRWNPTTSAWDLAWSNVGAKAGAGPYTRTRNNISDLGTFAVGGKVLATYVQLSAKVFLQGPYPTSGTSPFLMSDALRTSFLLPKAENSTAPSGQTPRPNGFTHQAWGGGEDASSYSSLSNQPSTNDNIVDWVFVELRDPSVSSLVLHTRAALLQKDGDIVNEDGTSPLKIYGVPDGSYFISIKHRNHIAVRSATTKILSRTATTVMDFTTSLSEALTPISPITNAAMATVVGSKYALWGGNANGDASITMTGFSVNNNDYLKLRNTLGLPTNVLSNLYSIQDLNMDGSVTMTGFAASNNDYLRLRNILVTPTATISQPPF